MLPTVSVVIPTHGRRDVVLRAVDAVLDDAATTEVVVVDDGSTDGTIDVLRERAAREPRLHPLRIDHGGQARARQAGVERATGEVVLLLDDDVIAEPGLVTGHARRHADRRELVVVGYMPTRRPEPRRRGQFATELYADDYEWATARWDEDPGSILRSLWGGNLSIRRNDALRVGLVAAGPPLPYREDTELGIRLEVAGLRAVFDRRLLARHEHTRDLEGFLREARSRGVGAVLVHRAHPNVLGELRPDRYEESLPAPGRWAVRGARRPALARAEVALLRAVIVAAGLARWWRVESLAARVAMHVVEARTVIDVGRPPS